MTYDELVNLTYCPICEKKFGPSLTEKHDIFRCENDCFGFMKSDYDAYAYLLWDSVGAVRLKPSHLLNETLLKANESLIDLYIKHWREDYRYIAEILTRDEIND